MGLFSSKKKVVKSTSKQLSSWKYISKNISALKVLNKDNLISGKLEVPFKLLEFFDINKIPINEEHSLKLVFLNGEYDSSIKLINKETGLIILNKDLLNVLIGIKNSVIREYDAASLYIKFVKREMFKYTIEVGTAR